MNLTPKTIDRAGVLGAIDVSLRNDNDQRVMYMIAIVDGTAKVYTNNRSDLEFVDEYWTYFADIGSAIDVAIEFDGRWERMREGDIIKWRLFTFGEPWIFWVTPTGDLMAQQLGGASTTLATGVTKIDTTRSWKNVYRWNHDHGIIVAYIRSNTVYYRTYALQGTDAVPLPAAWEVEVEVVSLPTPAQNVAVTRTNDYRSIVLCESEGEIHWSFTERNWAGMAIIPHYIEVEGTELSIDLLAITYDDGYEDHTITARGTEIKAMLCPPEYPEVVEIKNLGTDDTVEIYIELSLDIYGDGVGLEDAFVVVDEASTNYTVISTEKGIDDKVLILHTDDFEGAIGDLTVTYTFDTAPIYSQVEGGCLMELDDFSISFTPDLMPPEGYTENTITVEGTELLIDFILVTYHNGYTEHTIEATGTELYIELINVEDIPP